MAKLSMQQDIDASIGSFALDCFQHQEERPQSWDNALESGKKNFRQGSMIVFFFFLSLSLHPSIADVSFISALP